MTSREELVSRVADVHLIFPRHVAMNLADGLLETGRRCPIANMSHKVQALFVIQGVCEVCGGAMLDNVHIDPERLVPEW